jgi:hypothetical protein
MERQVMVEGEVGLAHQVLALLVQPGLGHHDRRARAKKASETAILVSFSQKIARETLRNVLSPQM